MMLDRVGPERFAAELRLAGAAPRVTGGANGSAGLAVALGGVGMTARELAVLYAALGDGGMAKPLVWRAEDEAENYETPGHRLMSPESADDILRILRNAPMPEGRMPGRLTQNAPDIAFKTGTSYGFRDSWAAAVSGKTAIIVWVGRADGAPRPGITGRTAALPILFEIADRAAHHLKDSGQAYGRLTTERAPKALAPQRDFVSVAPPEILFPPRNAELWAGTVDGQAPRAFVLAGRGEGVLRWFIDGEPCELDASGAPVWRPNRAGFYRITAVDSEGRSSDVRVRVLTGPS